MSCGGLSAAKEVDQDIHDMVAALKTDAETKAGKQFDSFTAKIFKSQVVAGTNYFIKVHVGDGDHIHMRVFKPLPHTNQGPEVHSVQVGKTEGDSIEYF